MSSTLRGTARSLGPGHLAAAASFAAGIVHLGAIRSHAGDAATVVAFFGAIAVFQLAWAVLAMQRPGRRLWRAGVAVNLAVAAIWVVSRTTGLPFGPHAGHVEAVGGADLLATMMEAAVVGASIVLARRAGWSAPVAGKNRLAFALFAAVLALAPLPGAAGESPSRAHSVKPAGKDSPPARLPVAANVVFGYAKGRPVALTYVQQYFCTVDPGDDLDGPGHEGDGIIAAADPNEMLAPPCIIGKTRRGSMPAVDPTGRDARYAPRIYGIIPWFDSDGDGVDENNDPTPGIQTACPQPGPPYTVVAGAPQTCTMHPTTAHAEPYLRTLAGWKAGTRMPTDVPAADITGGNHSHVIDYTSSPARWWLIVAVIVHDASIWPDFKGRCPAGRGCLTSVAAIRAAQRAGRVEPDQPTNAWFDFSVRPVNF